jgi:hypothetical protein
LEVPTIYKAYFSGLNFREYPQNIWPYMVLTYLHQLDPGDLPLKYGGFHNCEKKTTMNRWFRMENPSIQMDDLGVALF